MKKYEEPQIKIKQINFEDILTTRKDIHPLRNMKMMFGTKCNQPLESISHRDCAEDAL